MVGKIGFTFDDKKLEHKKGDDMGYFAFGGSTLVLIFKKGKIKIDPKFIKSIPEYLKVYKMYIDGKYLDVNRSTKVRLGQDIATKAP